MLKDRAFGWLSVNTISALDGTASTRPASDPLGLLVRQIGTPLRMALKRAGDWGQVAHCKRYNKVLVTRDQLLMLYAKTAGVRAVYVWHNENLDGQIPTLPSFMRYTFVIC